VTVKLLGIDARSMRLQLGVDGTVPAVVEGRGYVRCRLVCWDCCRVPTPYGCGLRPQRTCKPMTGGLEPAASGFRASADAFRLLFHGSNWQWQNDDAGRPSAEREGR